MISNDVEPECFAVRGTDSRGEFWMCRLCVGPQEYPTIKDAQMQAESKASRMNAAGANVTAVRQVLSKDGMTWRDARFKERNAVKSIDEAIRWWNQHSPEARGTMLESVYVRQRDHDSGTPAGSAARCYAVFRPCN